MKTLYINVMFSAVALSALAVLTTPAFAVVLFEDNFDGSGSLADRTPVTGNTWDGGSGGVVSGGRVLISGEPDGGERGKVVQDFALPAQSSGESLVFELSASVTSGGGARGGSFVLYETGNYEYFIPGLGGNPEGSGTDTYWRGSWLNTAPGSGAAALTNTTESSTAADTITRVTASAAASGVDFVYEVSTDSGANFSLMGGSAANATMSVPYADMRGGSATAEDPPTFNGAFFLARPGSARLDVDYLKITQTPEPSSLVLIFLGCLAVGCANWGRRQRN